MNIELLNKVKAHILEEPRRLEMVDWIVDAEEIPVEDNRPPCGTAGCIAGWAAMLDGGFNRSIHFPRRYATDALGIDPYGQAERLFYLSQWPAQFKFDKDRPDVSFYKLDKETQARLTAARIDYFIATNGTDVEVK